MKYIRVILTSFILIAALFVGVSPAQAACGDPLTRDKCGERVGCDPGEQCIHDPDGYNSSNRWKCVENEERCGVDRVDNSKGEHCDVTNGTVGWCGVSGGCANGYLCTEGGICKQDAGCANSNNVYNSMCGYWRSNSCATAGGCTEGYRCVQVASGETGTGYACLDVPDNDGNFCPGSPNASQPVETIQCDIVTNNPNAQCNCAATGNTLNRMGSSASYCCGLATADACYPSQAEYDAATGGGGGPGDDSEPGDGSGAGVGTTSPGDVGVGTTSGGGGGSGDSGSPSIDIFAGPNSQDFSDLNPLEDSAYVGDLSSPGGIISRVLLFAFPIAGLILFLMLVWAGFEILSKAPSGKSIDAGKQRATAAIVGFILLFCTYWIMQVVEYVFGIVVL